MSDLLFWTEAAMYQVLPLHATVATRIVTPRPSITAGRTVFTWRGELLATPVGDAPSILNASYRFKAEVEIPQGGAEGMIVTEGGRYGGWGFVGADTGTPVNDAGYQIPFRFTGKLDKLTLAIDRPTLSPEDEKKLMEAERNNHISE